jgi:DNA-binding MarR family transcriptional regulator
LTAAPPFDIVQAVNTGELQTTAEHGGETAISLEAKLGLLSAVETEREITQRSLAGSLGVALGLANALLKRCVHKGYVKISQAPARRYAYYLTPTGFAEKSRLVGEYLATSLRFFQRARGEYADQFSLCAERGWTRILLAGTGELAEIALLSRDGHGVTIAAVLDPSRNAGEFHGIPVVRTLSEAGPIDAVIVANRTSPQEVFDALAAQLPAERVLTVPILHVSRKAAGR